MLLCAGTLSTPRTKALLLRSSRHIAAPCSEDADVTIATGSMSVQSIMKACEVSRTFANQIQVMITDVVHRIHFARSEAYT